MIHTIQNQNSQDISHIMHICDLKEIEQSAEFDHR